MKIKAGDNVVVIAGKHKGKTGKVLRVNPKTERIVVEDVNMVTRHMRKTPQRPGQKVQFEAPIHVSNVMLVDPKSKKRTRVGYQKDSKGVKQRITKNSKTTL